MNRMLSTDVVVVVIDGLYGLRPSAIVETELLRRVVSDYRYAVRNVVAKATITVVQQAIGPQYIIILAIPPSADEADTATILIPSSDSDGDDTVISDDDTSPQFVVDVNRGGMSYTTTTSGRSR